MKVLLKLHRISGQSGDLAPVAEADGALALEAVGDLLAKLRLEELLLVELRGHRLRVGRSDCRATGSFGSLHIRIPLKVSLNSRKNSQILPKF